MGDGRVRRDGDEMLCSGERPGGGDGRPRTPAHREGWAGSWDPELQVTVKQGGDDGAHGDRHA